MNVKYILLSSLLILTQQVLANEVLVKNVELECTDTCYISVTLLHQDKGWDHYANRWEVLSPSGEILATRVLHHPHDDEQPFTRSLSAVNLPKTLDYVLIRGHDSQHGYGDEYKIELNHK